MEIVSLKMRLFPTQAGSGGLRHPARLCVVLRTSPTINNTFSVRNNTCAYTVSAIRRVGEALPCGREIRERSACHRGGCRRRPVARVADVDARRVLVVDRHRRLFGLRLKRFVLLSRVVLGVTLRSALEDFLAGFALLGLLLLRVAFGHVGPLSEELKCEQTYRGGVGTDTAVPTVRRAFPIRRPGTRRPGGTYSGSRRLATRGSGPTPPACRKG